MFEILAVLAVAALGYVGIALVLGLWALGRRLERHDRR